MEISFGYLNSYCIAYFPYKAGYVTLNIFPLGEFKLNWVNKQCYLEIYFLNNPNRFFDGQEQIQNFTDQLILF